jgi:DNA-binding GntR family transcriptional regulator
MVQSFERGDLEWEARVVAAHHKLAQMETRMLAGDASEMVRWKSYDWEFHQALISACGSAVLMSAHGAAFDRYLRYQMIGLSFRGQVAANEHALLRECALRRDVGAAVACLEAHLRGGVDDALRRAHLP